jgi:hypothetical protein
LSPTIYSTVRQLCRSADLFTERSNGLVLRSYQLEPATAICRSVLDDLGLSFVIIFPRQSGKNELQAQIESYLLAVCSLVPAEIVKISPTWKPQSQNAMRRLQRVLEKSLVLKGRWQKESGYIYRVDKARVYFFSGQPESSIVGATASTLLEVDEAQDVLISKYDKEIAPMAASTNATRVFWGTAWTSHTLLARELSAAQDAERQDGIQRTFILTADDVAAEVPAYGKFVQEQIAKLGRNNPMVKTQYFSETIDAEGGMFNAARRALMQGRHIAAAAPLPDRIYAITLDVAGEDESARDEPGAALQNQGRDSTALTIFDVDTTSLDDPLISRPTYKTVGRHQWTGIKHFSLFARLTAIIDHWSPAWLVIDATGVGQTLAGFLLDRYPNNTLPFVFTSSSKSTLGWNFIALIETGRYKEYQPYNSPPYQGGAGGGSDAGSLQRAFWTQVENCQYHIIEGPGQMMRWGVPDGTRDPRTGDLVHDDLVISAALVSELDAQPFGLALSKVVKAPELFDQKDF